MERREGEPLEQAHTVPVDPAELEVPPIGTRIGRFSVEGLLGAGGMGVVVSARDPDLDRSVALKLVRTGGSESIGAEERRQRLVREARAMAGLRHPNVLTIYEAGTHGDRVFVAMERVSTGTLRQVLAARGRDDWQAAVRRYVDAGRGLAAAHAAGLVHRDFKPDNVLVDGERVLVADFGLVGAQPTPPPTALNDDEPVGGALTRDDSVLGTPAYMSPEQHVGKPADARSDQFAFCVSLYEALYGELPFAGSSRVDYVRAMRRDQVRPPPPRDPVPPWVREAVLRGLRADPDQRFPSMAALLDALAVDPERDRLFSRFRRFGVGAVALSVVVWAGASAVIGYELTYPVMLAVDLGCLALIGVFALTARHARRVAFNRKVIALGASAVLSALVLLAAGKLAGIPHQTVALMHLFSALCIAAAATILLDRRIAVITAGYGGAFLVAAADPGLFYAASFVAHSLMAGGLVWILGEK